MFVYVIFKMVEILPDFLLCFVTCCDVVDAAWADFYLIWYAPFDKSLRKSYRNGMAVGCNRIEYLGCSVGGWYAMWHSPTVSDPAIRWPIRKLFAPGHDSLCALSAFLSSAKRAGGGLWSPSRIADATSGPPRRLCLVDTYQISAWKEGSWVA